MIINPYCRSRPRYSGKARVQHEAELMRFVALAATQRSYLEIGVKYGDTFQDIVLSMQPGSLAVALDWPGNAYGEDDSAAYLTATVGRLCKAGYQVRLFYGDSHRPEIQAAVAEVGPFDLIFIDADHTYEAVRQDWELYGQLGKRVAFHDIAGQAGVALLWSQLRERWPTREIVAPGSGYGIGIVQRDA